jgi:hypothetical protein
MSNLDYQGGEVLAALESQFVPKLVAKPKPEITIKNAIVCSFYTSDDYYKSHGSRLRTNLEELGIEVDLREITKKEGEDWAAICRKKVGFIAEVYVTYVTKTNLIGGKEFQERYDTPSFCSPSSESYWSM